MRGILHSDDNGCSTFTWMWKKRRWKNGEIDTSACNWNVWMECIDLIACSTFLGTQYPNPLKSTQFTTLNYSIIFCVRDLARCRSSLPIQMDVRCMETLLVFAIRQRKWARVLFMTNMDNITFTLEQRGYKIHDNNSHAFEIVIPYIHDNLLVIYLPTRRAVRCYVLRSPEPESRKKKGRNILQKITQEIWRRIFTGTRTRTAHRIWWNSM